jgi:deoxyribodipyrimidine photolyase
LVKAQEECGPEEKQVERNLAARLQDMGASLELFFDHTLFRVADLPFEAPHDLPEPFTRFRNVVENADNLPSHMQRDDKVSVRALLPTPALLPAVPSPAHVGYPEGLPTLPELGYTNEESALLDSANAAADMNFEGGEDAGLRRVEAYSQSGGLGRYKHTRNGLMGEDFSTKFSPWLAVGALSPRHVYWQVERFNQEAGGQSLDTYWVVFELMFRDFFRLYGWKHAGKLFGKWGPAGEPPSLLPDLLPDLATVREQVLSPPLAQAEQSEGQGKEPLQEHGGRVENHAKGENAEEEEGKKQRKEETGEKEQKEQKEQKDFCEACDKQFTGASQLQYHLDGSKHKAALGEPLEPQESEATEEKEVERGGVQKESATRPRWQREWGVDDAAAERWREGQTGLPFVDAFMRQLGQTGYMSNRGRQQVASYLVYDLGLDWRIGADHFEATLIDHEVCANYGNWAFSAGIGTRNQRQRRFNVLKQAAGDEQAVALVRRWVPELREVPDEALHWPWEWVAAGNSAPGYTYPEPLTKPSWSAKGRANAQNPRWKKSRGRLHRGDGGLEFTAT